MSPQSTLDGTIAGEEHGGASMAEEMAAAQRSISVAEFFEQNKQMLGFDSRARAIVTAVKEGVDNALDAGEEAGILPDVYINISKNNDIYTLVIEDNGPGILPDQIPNVFGQLLYGSRFHAREQNRGQQGLGISAAVLYSQLTSGSPARVISKSIGHDTAHRCELMINTDENEPELSSDEEIEWDRDHGTRIELDMEANMRARKQLLSYIRYNAIVNPHARIQYDGPKVSFTLERASDELPSETEEILPHPHGIQIGTLQKMLASTDSYSLSGFLGNEFSRVGSKSANAILDELRDRLYGRAGAWSATDVDDEMLINAIEEAVSNKPAGATLSFAERITDRLLDGSGADPLSAPRYATHEIGEIVADVSESVENDTGAVFGDTVQDNATRAAWTCLADGRESDIRAIVDDVTSTQKDDVIIGGLAQRLTAKFDDVDNHRVTHDTLREFVDRAAETTESRTDAAIGHTARENITEGMWKRMRTVSDDVPKVKAIADERNMANLLLASMRATDLISPPSDCLSPVGEESIKAGLKSEYNADFYASVTRSASVYGGDPFIAEAGIAYGGDIEEEESIELLRFANRVPLVYQPGACAVTGITKTIGWRNYQLSQSNGSLPKGPVVLFVHVVSTNIPFTSESKDAIASVPEIEDEIERAIRGAARKMKSHIKSADKRRERRRKETAIADILPAFASKVTTTTGREMPDISDSLARVMNNVLVTHREASTFDEEIFTEMNDDVDFKADAAIDVWNFSNNGSASIDVTVMTDAEPGGVGNEATITENGNGWEINWSTTVSSNDQVRLPLATDGETVEITVDGIPEERVTVAP